jgi:hypothetical protein
MSGDPLDPSEVKAGPTAGSTAGDRFSSSSIFVEIDFRRARFSSKSIFVELDFRRRVRSRPVVDGSGTHSGGRLRRPGPQGLERGEVAAQLGRRWAGTAGQARSARTRADPSEVKAGPTAGLTAGYRFSSSSIVRPAG